MTRKTKLHWSVACGLMAHREQTGRGNTCAVRSTSSNFRPLAVQMSASSWTFPCRRSECMSRIGRVLFVAGRRSADGEGGCSHWRYAPSSQHDFREVRFRRGGTGPALLSAVVLQPLELLVRRAGQAGCRQARRDAGAPAGGAIRAHWGHRVVGGVRFFAGARRPLA